MPCSATKVFVASIVDDFNLSLVAAGCSSCIVKSSIPKNQFVVVLFVFVLAVIVFAVAKERRQGVMNGAVIAKALLFCGIAGPFRASQGNELNVVFFADGAVPSIETFDLTLCHHDTANGALLPYRSLLAESFQSNQFVELVQRGIGVSFDIAAVGNGDFGGVFDGSEFRLLVPQFVAVLCC